MEKLAIIHAFTCNLHYSLSTSTRADDIEWILNDTTDAISALLSETGATDKEQQQFIWVNGDDQSDYTEEFLELEAYMVRTAWGLARLLGLPEPLHLKPEHWGMPPTWSARLG